VPVRLVLTDPTAASATVPVMRTSCSPFLLAVAAALPLTTLLALPRVARADVSSWYSLAGGASVIDQATTVASPLLDIDAGLGTTPVNPLVFGALVHVGAQFAVGADVGGAFRVCTGSYARGDWGLGVDLGSHYRVATYGGAAGSARVFFGAPWGVVLHLGGSYGENGVGTLSASLGLDFARLSTHRSYFTDVLPSPLSSPDQPAPASSAPPLPAAASLAPTFGL